MRWKRSRRPGLSVGRIVLVAMLLATLAIYGLQRLRPVALPWHDVGSERIVTPEFDISDPATRDAMNRLRRGWSLPIAQNGRWLGERCGKWPTPVAEESYVLTVSDAQRMGEMAPAASRTVVTLTTGGELVHERFVRGSTQLPERTRRSLSATDAEQFRGLLIDGGYLQMPPAQGLGICHGGATVMFESCVRGRYYGVVRTCGALQGDDPLDALAAAIEDFATK